MRTLHTLAFAALTALCVALPAATTDRAATACVATACGIHNPSSLQQLRADEITRRLRRMGFEYIVVPNGRPKEAVGEIC